VILWSALAEILVRTAHLLALAVVPSSLSPEPALPTALPASAAAAALVLVCWLGLPVLAGRRLGSRLALGGAALLWVALLAAAVAAVHFRGDQAPLARGIWFVAPPLWVALALLAGEASRRLVRRGSRRWQIGAAVAVLTLAALQFLQAGAVLTSREAMWWAALAANPDDARALPALSGSAVRARDHAGALAVADKCLARHPLPAAGMPSTASCACLELRIDALLAGNRAPQAVPDAAVLSERCPQRPLHRALYAQALAATGQSEAARTQALMGLVEKGDLGRLHYALALAAMRQGQAAIALTEAGDAVEAGAGRDARLLAGMAAIVTGDLDAADRWLAPLAQADPGDAQAQYDLALVADKRGDYNRAREGYLAALRADPGSADARYNLAVLTYRAGILAEAQHHARQFRESFPDDPRGAPLSRLVATDPHGSASASSGP
jgi:tetratricopeptide (TPR) repeat protein